MRFLKVLALLSILAFPVAAAHAQIAVGVGGETSPGACREPHPLLSICVPNHLHDAHARFALRVGADAICEKPLVSILGTATPWRNWRPSTGTGSTRSCNSVCTPADRAEGKPVAAAGRPETRCLPDVRHLRGPWYLSSWKGNVERSGGLATNIGIHFFDMLLWLFGPLEFSEVHEATPVRTGGCLELQKRGCNGSSRSIATICRNRSGRAASRRFARSPSTARR